jgi:signal transduction histidine kinase
MNFEVIAHEALVGLLVFDKKSNTCIYANHLAKDILHLSDSKLILDLNSFQPTEVRNRNFKIFNLSLMDHEGLHQEVIMRRPNGGNFIAQLGVKHFVSENKSHTLLMIQDMTVQAKLHRELENKQTQLKTAFEDLLKQNAELKELDAAKTKFIALVTHELRTPTSGIVATSEMLKLGLYEGESELKEFVGMIHSEGRLLLELINDILDFAKIQSGRMDFYIEQKDLRTLAEETIEPLKSIAEATRVSIINEMGDSEALCYFDSLRMHQIVNNLVSNGIKYNKPNGTVTLKINTTEEYVQLHIIDTGKGISEENQPKIFNEFETLGKISNHTKGTGLGLPIAKKMIEAMGGHIEFTSQLGKGSNFWINVPINKVLGDSESYRERIDPGSGDLAA